MNPHYLWLTEAIELLTFFVLMPTIAIAIAYAAWRGKPQNASPKQYGTVCVASGVTSSLLILFAKWINADVRTPQYFVQLACLLSALLLFGVSMGCGLPVLLHFWRWHRATRLTDGKPTER
jgi:protein-S-isoprenylcysteine O-methyltransferase Ste14